MKKFLILLLLVFTARKAISQGQGYTNVTGTKLCFAGGSVQAAFVNNSGQPQLPLLNGSVFPTTGVTNFNQSGAFSFYLADNNQIFPTPTQWKITACSKSGGQQNCGSVTLTVTGATQDISSQLAPFACPTGAVPPGTYVQVVGDTMTGTLNNSAGFNGPVTGNVTGNVTGTASGNVAFSPAANQTVAQPASTSLTITGAGGGLNSSITNTVYNAGSCGFSSPPSWCSGSDIGAWVNAAFAACGGVNCHIYIPAATYTQTTTILFTYGSNDNIHLECDKNAYLNYTGSSYAINTGLTTQALTYPSHVLIKGCNIQGTAAAAGGIRSVVAGQIDLGNSRIWNFTNGDGFFCDGCELDNIHDSYISLNLNGIHYTTTRCLQSSPFTCSANQSGTTTLYQANANHFVHNSINGNSHWAIFDDQTLGATDSNNNNEISGNGIEGNGTAGAAYGAILISYGYGDVIEKNYIEGNPRGVVIGTGCCNNSGTVINNNYFTSSSSVKYPIEILTSIGTMVYGNVELNSGTVSTCFVNINADNNTNYVMNSVVDTNYLCAGGNPVALPATETMINGGTVTANSISARAINNSQVAAFAIGPNAGTGAAIGTCASGWICTPNSGIFSLTTGTGPTSGTVAVISWPASVGHLEACTFNAYNSTGATSVATIIENGSSSSNNNTSVNIYSSPALAASTSYNIYYVCF